MSTISAKTDDFEPSEDQPPTMLGNADGSVGKGSFVPARCTTQELKEEIFNVFDLAEKAASISLAPSLETFVNYGAEDNESLRANRKGFERYALRPRVARDVSHPDYSTTILNGRIQLSFPLCIAPFAGCRAIHPDGEVAIATAASKAGIAYTIPHWAACPIENILDAAGEAGPLLFQVYPNKPTHSEEGMHRAYIRQLLASLAQTGSTNIVGIVLTLDTVNNGNREKTYKNQQWTADLETQVGGFPKPNGLGRMSETLPNVPEVGISSSVTWNDVRWMKRECSKHGFALIVKGIMTREDTILAVQAGVDAVIVSNHGGRQLDGTLGTVDVVEECVLAARGRLEVYVDGGIRRGKDIAKCLALGAKCVFVGRPILWGLAVGGQTGIARALTILQEEFKTVMQLCGCSATSQLTRDFVRDRQEKYSKNRQVEDTGHIIGTAVIGAIAVTVAFALGRRSR